jgi:hypothetical protein
LLKKVGEEEALEFFLLLAKLFKALENLERDCKLQSNVHGNNSSV